MTIQKWNIEDFKAYCRKQIDKHYYETPSMVVLRSFHIAKVEKPPEITVTSFDYLRAVAEKEMNDYKAQKSPQIKEAFH